MGIPRDAIDLASTQGGLVTRSQLLEMGHLPGGVDWLVRSGDFTMIEPGVYRVLPPLDHADVLRGAVLVLPDAVASHQSAAHILKLPSLPTLVPTVTVPTRTTHRFPGVTVRRSDDHDPSHVIRVDGLAVTSVARTLFDLAGVIDFRAFDLIAEAAIVDGRVSMRQFDRVVSSLARRGKRGSRSTRDFIALRRGTDPRATKLERRGRELLAAAGLPRPVPQLAIPWEPRHRFDDAYPDAKLALEWDSRAWHQQRAAMRDDRARDRKAAVHGWQVVRFTWQDVTESPREVTGTVGRLLDMRLPPPKPA